MLCYAYLSLFTSFLFFLINGIVAPDNILVRRHRDLTSAPDPMVTRHVLVLPKVAVAQLSLFSLHLVVFGSLPYFGARCVFSAVMVVRGMAFPSKWFCGEQL